MPHDKASATDAINAVIREVENLTSYIATNAKEIVRAVVYSIVNDALTGSALQPHTAQARAQPLIDGLSEAAAHIKAELVKSGTWLGPAFAAR